MLTTSAAASPTFRERMEAIRGPRLVRTVPVGDWTTVDLLRHDRILGAAIWAKPDPQYFGADRAHGHAVYCDDEGVRVIEIIHRYGKPGCREHFIDHDDVDNRETLPGGHHARHKLARQLVEVVAAGRGQITDYERRLLGFASALSHPSAS